MLVFGGISTSTSVCSEMNSSRMIVSLVSETLLLMSSACISTNSPMPSFTFAAKEPSPLIPTFLPLTKIVKTPGYQ